tara:strand:- start:752 stop:1885 length:1134 start_codon:yes stop_codon:yes gene_type:complete
MKEKIIDCVKKTPGITAKEIGKLLGVTRKKINQQIQNFECLHKDSNTFGWHYQSEYPIVAIQLPSKWISSYAFEKTLNASEYSEVGSEDIIVNFAKDSKLMMDAIARFICLVNQVALAGRKVTIDMTLSKDSFSYLNRAGFYKVLHPDVIILPKRPKIDLSIKYEGNTNRLVEFKKLLPDFKDDSIPEELFKSLNNWLVSKASIEKDFDPIFTFIAEIFNNVYDHVFDLEQTELHGLAACQTYSRNENTILTQIVISDCGQGIANTLRPALIKNDRPDKLTKLTDIKLIQKALTVGKLTRHNPETDPDHGLGLYIGAMKAKMLDAKITIRQENFSIRFAWKGEELKLERQYDDLKSIPGTNICFDFNIEQSKLICLN